MQDIFDRAVPVQDHGTAPASAFYGSEKKIPPPSSEGTVPYYRIGFRLYVDMFSDWKKYADCWHNGDTIRTDSRGRKIIGDVEQMDETIAHYSKRIQMRDTKVNLSAMQNSMYSGTLREPESCKL